MRYNLPSPYNNVISEFCRTLESRKLDTPTTVQVQSSWVAKLKNLKFFEGICLDRGDTPQSEGFEKNVNLPTYPTSNSFGAHFSLTVETKLRMISTLILFSFRDMQMITIPRFRITTRRVRQAGGDLAEGNPCQGAEGANYQRKVMFALPQVDAMKGVSLSPPLICPHWLNPFRLTNGRERRGCCLLYEACRVPQIHMYQGSARYQRDSGIIYRTEECEGQLHLAHHLSIWEPSHDHISSV